MTLWPHQQQAVPRLLAGNHFLAWEPGTGKTAPALVAGRELGGRQLYLCPASIRHQIEEEARRVIPDATVQVVSRTAEAISDDADVVVVSYDMAASTGMWPRLFARRWSSLVLDEAHRLKNPEAKRTRAVYGFSTKSKGALIRSAQRIWAMSGTPIVNNPSDLWVHYHRLFPQALLDEEGFPLRRRVFEDRFCVKRYTAFGEQIVGGKNIDELRAAFVPRHMSQLTRAEVIHDLPRRIVDVIPLEGEHLKVSAAPEDLALLEAALGDGQDEALEGLAFPLATMRQRLAIAKASAVAALIRDELDSGVEKILVFGMHPGALERVAALLPGRDTPVLVTGATPPAYRRDRVNRFRQDTACRVFLGQIHAAGEGLNLQVASRVIFLDAAWSPSANEQAICRADRAGQTHPVHVSFCSLKGSIDEDVARALARKAKIINQFMPATGV